MKKLVLFLFAAFLLGCNKDDDAEAFDVVGAWDLLEMRSQSEAVTYLGEGSYADFTPEGLYTITVSRRVEGGVWRWKLEGSYVPEAGNKYRLNHKDGVAFLTATGSKAEAMFTLDGVFTCKLRARYARTSTENARNSP